jgi:hypothetical protein
MILAKILISAYLTGIVCVASPMSPKDQWLTGTFKVKPVVPELQAKMLEHMRGNSLEPIKLSFARSASGDVGLPSLGHYYLVAIAYVGDKRDEKAVPAGLSLSVDVDRKGVAYVTSYRLTSERGTSHLVAVLASEVPLKGVVSVCGAAQ